MCIRLKRLLRKRRFITEEHQRGINEDTMEEVERILKELEEEEQYARDIVIESLKEIFNDLPCLL